MEAKLSGKYQGHWVEVKPSPDHFVEMGRPCGEVERKARINREEQLWNQILARHTAGFKDIKISITN